MDLLTELQKYYPYYLHIWIESVDFDATIPFVILHLTYEPFDVEDHISQRWKVLLNGYKEAKISSNDADELVVSTDHALLWKHQYSENSVLYFNGVPPDIFRLYWEIIQLHITLYEKYQDAEQYLNAPNQFERLWQFGAGMFAKGPAPLLQKYAELLARHGVRTDYKAVKKAMPPMKVLILGDTFIVANEFEFSRLA